ncbi:MAG: transglutaminase-like domain-containing protein [Myxococcales bacterium]|jgi:hypothetical protein|nr:transglutaminase-like domain-containing protein [Myxococcales bacterium]
MTSLPPLHRLALCPLARVALALITCFALLAPLPRALAATAETPRLSQAEREALIQQLVAVGEEWFGIYVLGQKAGAMKTSSRLGEHEGRATLFVTAWMRIHASIGANEVEREVQSERVYDLSAAGQLIAFREERIGDGGDESLTGRCTSDGIELVRHPKGKEAQTHRLPATRESLDSVLNALLVLKAGNPISYAVFDLETRMADKRVTMAFVGQKTVEIAGVPTPLNAFSITEEDSRVSQTILVREDGRTHEIHYGNVMTAKAEPREKATEQGRIEVFGSTRVVLGGGSASSGQRLSEQTRQAPSQVVYELEGLPQNFWTPGTGQHFTPVVGAKDRVRLTVTAALPTKPLKLPLSVQFVQEERLGEWLKPTLTVESEDPRIVALTKKTIGKSTDAFEVAKKLSRFVYRHLKKSYGVSSDRATRVLDLKEGDCTEHALLFTSMARAAGIPARRVNGLVYMEETDGIPSLYWHEWAEVFVGEWLPIDPTFDQSVADAGHLAFGIEGQNDVAVLFGQLKVTVVRASKPGVKASDSSEKAQ